MANPFLPDLSQRYRGAEVIDSPDFAGDELKIVLRHLSRVNRVLGNYRSVIVALFPLLKKMSGPVHIVDIGCGGGDLMCYLSHRCRKEGIEVRFTGVDFNPHMIQHAGNRLCNDDNVSFVCADVLDPDFELPHCDIVLSSHFIYRFSDAQLVEFIRQNEDRVSTAFVFSELRRSAWGYFLFATFGYLLFPDRVTIADGLVAIRRSFKFIELKRIVNSLNTRSRIYRRPFFRQIAVIPVGR